MYQPATAVGNECQIRSKRQHGSCSGQRRERRPCRRHGFWHLWRHAFRGGTHSGFTVPIVLICSVASPWFCLSSKPTFGFRPRLNLRQDRCSNPGTFLRQLELFRMAIQQDPSEPDPWWGSRLSSVQVPLCSRHLFWPELRSRPVYRA